jgi:hypothetical protein
MSTICPHGVDLSVRWSCIDCAIESMKLVYELADSKIAIAERERSLAAKYERGAVICFWIWVASWLVILLSRVF